MTDEPIFQIYVHNFYYSHKKSTKCESVSLRKGTVPLPFKPIHQYQYIHFKHLPVDVINIEQKRANKITFFIWQLP